MKWQPRHHLHAEKCLTHQSTSVSLIFVNYNLNLLLNALLRRAAVGF